MIKKLFDSIRKSTFLPIVSIIVAIVSLSTVYFTFNQVTQEQSRMTSDIQYRSSLLAKSLKESVEPNFINNSDAYLKGIVEKFVDKQRIAGLAVVDNTGKVITESSALPQSLLQSQQTVITNVMDADLENGVFTTYNNKRVYVFASPLEDGKSVVGALVIVQNASYMDSRIFEIIQNNFVRLLIQAIIVSVLSVILIRWVIYEPIKTMVDALRLARTGSADRPMQYKVSSFFFQPLAKELARVRQTLLEARLQASEEARHTLERLDSPWTSQRLQEFIKDTAKDRKIFLISNREPYVHKKVNNHIAVSPPVSGMVTALESVMQSCGGTWIAYGSGDADKDVVDKKDSVAVPPDDPKYTLKRIWLTKEEINGYYNGFSNEGLWPLCHRAYARPIFRKEDWEQYKIANEKFAHAALVAMKHTEHPIVFVQDFHLALVPAIIKKSRPDATIGIFWHIPWPNPESFSILPWKKEILDGILGADVVGFHTQLHCNNFIETVSREVESLVDLERFTITRNNHMSFIKPFPISIAFPSIDTQTEKTEVEKIRKEFGIKSEFIGLGVDRLDYTKGILERLKAVEIFLIKNPQYQEKFTFLQISVPSRTEVKRYQDFRKEVEAEVERINNVFKKNSWKPIVLSLKAYSHQQVFRFYRLANFCLVSSLHDGMNLVAKEFVAARSDEKGVLILSEFTGASKELASALLINPYNGEQTAAAIKQALEMSKAEQTKRMRVMRDAVRSHNVYRWSAEIIKALVTLG